MYNRYLNAAPDTPAPVSVPVHTAHEPAEPVGLFGSLSRRLGGLRLDTDMLVVIAVVWFLIQDSADGDIDLEIVLAIGALLILGL